MDKANVQSAGSVYLHSLVDALRKVVGSVTNAADEGDHTFLEIARHLGNKRKGHEP